MMLTDNEKIVVGRGGGGGGQHWHDVVSLYQGKSIG